MKDSVVLVGNGGSLNGAKLGSVIDKFGTVVRFNEFKLDGGCEDVGANLDLWATNEGPIWHGMRNHEVPRGTSHLILVPYWKSTEPRCWERAMDECPAGAHVVDERVARAATELFEDRGPNIWASTGLLAVLHYALRLPALYLAGFDFFHNRDRHHYWGPNDQPCGHHDGRTEAAIVDSIPERFGCNIYHL